jgi:hypothetical protein
MSNLHERFSDRVNLFPLGVILLSTSLLVTMTAPGTTGTGAAIAVWSAQALFWFGMLSMGGRLLQLILQERDSERSR